MQAGEQLQACLVPSRALPATTQGWSHPREAHGRAAGRNAACGGTARAAGANHGQPCAGLGTGTLSGTARLCFALCFLQLENGPFHSGTGGESPPGSPQRLAAITPGVCFPPGPSPHNGASGCCQSIAAGHTQAGVAAVKAVPTTRWGSPRVLLTPRRMRHNEQ